MTKFADRGAPGYEDVVGELQRLAGNTGIDRTDPRPMDHVAESNTSEMSETHHTLATQPLSNVLPANSTNNYGSGTLNANTGEGIQNNATGSGKQFVGGRQYFAREDLE
jgi:hypothetical protein